MSIISRIRTGLSDWEWQQAWKDVQEVMTKYSQFPMPSFEEWRAFVIDEGANRQFIHRVYGKRISLRSGVKEVIKETVDFDPVEYGKSHAVRIQTGE